MALPTVRSARLGIEIDLEAFAQRWMAGTMTPADDRLWAEVMVPVDSIRVAVLHRVGY